MQPHVVILSDELTVLSRSKAYACIHSSMYFQAASVMEAVDICMKSTFVFGVQYPVAANSCWLFLQKAVYGISSRFDRLSSKVLELLSDLNASQK